MNGEPNIQDVLEAISDFSKNVDERFDSLETDVSILKKDVGTLKQDVGILKQDIGILKQDYGTMKKDVGVLKTAVVTKDYLDEKIADLRGDLVTLSRKGNRKFEAAIHELVLEGNLKPHAAKEILSMEPFPSLG